MGDSYFGKVRSRVAASSTSSGAFSTTIAAPSDVARRYFVTGIQCSSDVAALVTIESPASTVIWRKRYTAAFAMSESFPPGTVNGAAGQAVLVKISAATTNGEGNIQAMLV